MNEFKDLKYRFDLPDMPYAYDALNPYIETQIMELHHDKHHRAYVNNLNLALDSIPELKGKSLFELVKNWQTLPESCRQAVRNNGGGHMNHTMFWELMIKNGGGIPKGKVGQEIVKIFGSLEAFKNQFDTAAKTVFGSGWAWLSLDNSGKLVITKTQNQDNPITEGLHPIMGLDVWEHAYYLQYFNRRADYIEAWWHVINWEKVEENYLELV